MLMASCRQSQKNENLNDLVALRCAMKLLRQVVSLFGYNFKFIQHRRPCLGVGLPNPCQVTGMPQTPSPWVVVLQRMHLARLASLRVPWTHTSASGACFKGTPVERTHRQVLEGLGRISRRWMSSGSPSKCMLSSLLQCQTFWDSPIEPSFFLFLFFSGPWCEKDRLNAQWRGMLGERLIVELAMDCISVTALEKSGNTGMGFFVCQDASSPWHIYAVNADFRIFQPVDFNHDELFFSLFHWWSALLI